MDAFELLKKDHKKVSKLFSEIESASGEKKTELFTQLKAELDLHAHIEETVLYPALENTEEAREITLEAYEEHNVVKDLLGELAKVGAPDDEWDAKLSVLKENVEHHVEEEEGELFSKARKALGEEKIEKLGAELNAEKARKSAGATEPKAAAKQTAAKKRAQPESPGVLKRIANMIGLGETPPTALVDKTREPGSRRRKAPATNSRSKSAAKSTSKPASKTNVSSKSGAVTPSKGAKSNKPAPKAAARKTAGKARSSRKASTSSKTAAPRKSRSSATRTVSRAASNQRVKAGRKRASGNSSKASTKTRRGSR